MVRGERDVMNGVVRVSRKCVMTVVMGWMMMSIRFVSAGDAMIGAGLVDMCGVGDVVVDVGIFISLSAAACDIDDSMCGSFTLDCVDVALVGVLFDVGIVVLVPAPLLDEVLDADGCVVVASSACSVVFIVDCVGDALSVIVGVSFVTPSSIVMWSGVMAAMTSLTIVVSTVWCVAI